jgi:excisionase family DNA binding protein
MSRQKVERNISYDDVRKKYYVNLDFGRDPDTGQRIKTIKTFDKLTEARSALRKHEVARDVGQAVIPKTLTLGQWLNTWMNDVIKVNRAATTVYSYQQMIDNHIVPALGKIQLQKLTPTHLQQYYAAKLREGKLSSNTVRKHHDLLNAALGHAVRQGLILINPAERTEPPRTTRPDINYYSLEELERLLKLCEGTRLEILIKLAGYLGLRREEIMGLTWDHVDFERKQIHICQARTMAAAQVITKDTKNDSSHRVLFMHPVLEDALVRERAKQEQFRSELGDAYQNSGYVFTHEDGRPIRPNYATKLFTQFIQDNDLPTITLHGLRHSFASIANAAGIPMYDIGRALGHSSTATTSKIYTHLLDQDHQSMLTKMWETKKRVKPLLPRLSNQAVSCFTQKGDFVMPETLPAVLTAVDLAKFLGVSKTTVYHMIHDGTIRNVKVGKQFRIPRQALEAFLNNS